MTRKRPLRRGGPGRRLKPRTALVTVTVTPLLAQFLGELGLDYKPGDTFTTRHRTRRHNFDGYKYLTDEQKQTLLNRRLPR